MSTTPNPLAEILEQYDTFARFTKTAAPEDWAAGTYYGLVLALGQPFERKPMPREFRRMKMGYCYSNAMHCVTRDGNTRYRYVEGYAGPMAFAHAWVLDTEDGKVFDPTWENDDKHQDYYGIVFPTEWVWRRCLMRGQYGLLGNDWLYGNEILHHGATLWTPATEAAA